MKIANPQPSQNQKHNRLHPNRYKLFKINEPTKSFQDVLNSAVSQKKV